MNTFIEGQAVRVNNNYGSEMSAPDESIRSTWGKTGIVKSTRGHFVEVRMDDGAEAFSGYDYLFAPAELDVV